MVKLIDGNRYYRLSLTLVYQNDTDIIAGARGKVRIV